MRKSLILGVFITTALIATAVAQQQNNSSSTAASGQGAAVSQSDREPLPADKHTDFWDGDDPSFGNLITHPFANKKYVERHVGPIRDRLSELDQISAENERNIKDADSRAQQGLQMASEKENLADQHSVDATNKAQLAQTAANDATTRVTGAEQRVGNLDQYKGTAQTEIRFRPGQSVLSKNAKDALDQMAEGLKSERSYIIEVRGFSTGRGQTAIASSQKMADSVVRYLVLTHGIPVYRIYAMSVGNATIAGEETPKHVASGRVEVSVLKNDVTTAQR